jgi:hypothetical protein
MIYKTGLSEGDISAMRDCIRRYEESAKSVGKAQKLAEFARKGSQENSSWIGIGVDGGGGAYANLDEQLREDLLVALDRFIARAVERRNELKLVLGQGEGEAE